MTIVVESNSDMPSCLNTEMKQAKKARQLAQSHTGVVAEKAAGPRIQGFFSRTMIVSLENGDALVIQFRPEVLDLEPFRMARRKFGHVVPDIGLLEDEELRKENIYAYWMTRIPGNTWFEGTKGQGSESTIGINKDLGRIFSQGCIKDDSEAVVEGKLRRHLSIIACSDRPEVEPFHAIARELLHKLSSLSKLPLFVSHFDLNMMNIMVDSHCQVSGIVDWELSSPLPFGAGFARIHTLAGEFSDGGFHMPDTFERAERGFWQEVFSGVPANIRAILMANLDAVQTSVHVGTLLSTFELDGDRLGESSMVSVKALPKFLTYRIPQIRGDELPYSI